MEAHGDTLRTLVNYALGRVPVRLLDQATREQIIQKCLQTYEPFNNNRPSDRVNFLQLNYLLNKVLHILEKPDLAKHYPLMYSRDKLQQHDVLWEKICRDLVWPFHRSV